MFIFQSIISLPRFPQSFIDSGSTTKLSGFESLLLSLVSFFLFAFAVVLLLLWVFRIIKAGVLYFIDLVRRRNNSIKCGEWSGVPGDEKIIIAQTMLRGTVGFIFGLLAAQFLHGYFDIQTETGWMSAVSCIFFTCFAIDCYKYKVWLFLGIFFLLILLSMPELAIYHAPSQVDAVRSSLSWHFERQDFGLVCASIFFFGIYSILFYSYLFYMTVIAVMNCRRFGGKAKWSWFWLFFFPIFVLTLLMPIGALTLTNMLYKALGSCIVAVILLVSLHVVIAENGRNREFQERYEKKQSQSEDKITLDSHEEDT